MGAVTFGLVPHVNDEATRAHLADFCQAVSDAAGIEVRPRRFPSPSMLADAFGAHETTLAWVSPGLLVLSPHLRTAVPLVSSVREGRAQYHAIVYGLASRRDRTDLAGARMAWVARTSAAGYAYPRLELRARGQEPERLFASEDFLGTYAAVVGAVTSGAADAGASYATFADGDPGSPLRNAAFLEVEGAPPMRILLVAGPIVADPIIASQRIPYADRVRLRAALAHVSADPAGQLTVRALFDADGFAPADPDEFAAMRARLQPEENPYRRLKN